MYPNNITDIHLELTDKCQAACPMCARNWYGGAERSYVQNTEISIDQFKQWFPVSFLKQLKNVYACGNLGDPLLAHDCLEIFEYLAEHTNDDCRLAIHTNGSLRNKEWWTKLATVMNPKGVVIIGIDGFKGDHELYRKNTNWDKIIENAKAFIEAGGHVRADSIVFKHNEHRTDELRDFLLGIGFREVNFKSTQRFFGLSEYPVKNKEGETEYYLHQPELPKWQEPVIKINMDRLIKPSVYKKLIDESNIVPDCFTKKEIFVDSVGRVFPCCQVAGTYTNCDFDGEGSEYVMRDRLLESARELVQSIGLINLKDTNIIDALANSDWGDKITHHTTVDKKLVCVKACSRNIRNLVEDKPSDQDYVKLC
jgi:MoaA/NifB/PqqE/SkfB family radical SAM enzyme